MQTFLRKQIWEWTGPRYNNLITKQADHLTTKIILKTKTLPARLLIKQETLSESCTDLAYANAPFRVREPPAGPEKLTYISPDCTFSKIWSIVPDQLVPNAQPKVIALEHLPHRSKATTQRKVLPDSQPIL